MTDRTTAFARKVSKLKPPTAVAFKLKEWEDAFSSEVTTLTDSQLLESARWLGAEAAKATCNFSNPMLLSLSPKWSTILAIATLNREFRTITDITNENSREFMKDDIASLDTLAAIQIKDASGQKSKASDINTTAVECAENWLFDAYKSNGALGADILDLAPAAVLAMKFYSFRRQLNDIWNRVWFDGWRILHDQNQNSYRWIPGDKSLEEMRIAWHTRHEAKQMAFPAIDQITWLKLSPQQRRRLARKRSVIEIRESKGKESLKVGSISYLSKRMPAYMYEKGVLEGSYIADFIDSPMPINPLISIQLLLQAWHILLDIANLLAIKAPLPDGALSPSDARKLALAIDRVKVVNALTDALQLEVGTSSAIIDFLTFAFQTGGTNKAKGNKGLWAAPVVRLPESSEVLLSMAVLATSNPVRRAEAWLEKGGINDDNPAGARGDRYEVLYRAKICSALARNKTFATAQCAHDGIVKTTIFNEQIDLLVAFGGLCLVGEVKFFLMPADTHEFDRYEKKLKDAAEQVKRKNLALQASPDIISNTLKIDSSAVSALKFLPIIVTNQGYRFSSYIDGVLVIDGSFLITYLTGGRMATNMVVRPRDGEFAQSSIDLYVTEHDAAVNFEKQMSKPYVLKRFLDRVSWESVKLLTLAHGDTEMAMPVLGDIYGYERAQAEVLMSKLV
jgi:hypothetical protein